MNSARVNARRRDRSFLLTHKQAAAFNEMPALHLLICLEGGAGIFSEMGLCLFFNVLYGQGSQYIS